MKHSLLKFLFVAFAIVMGNHIASAQCQAKYTYKIYNSDSVVFYDSSTVSAGSIGYYGWNFGDGNKGQGQNTSHVYTKSGTYYVCHNIYTTQACKDTICDSVQIVLKKPICDASFTFNINTSNPDSVHYLPKNTHNFKTYAWSFGDGKYSTDPNPWHYYGKPGKYYICMKVTDSTSGGTCSDTKCDSVTVGVKAPVCDASLSFNTSPTNADSLHFFPKNTSLKAKSYYWSFGDGTYSSSQLPWHLYKTGKYYVCLTTTDSNATGTCTDTKCDSVTVANNNQNPVCDASFTTTASQTNADSIHFYPKNSKNYKTYAWSFGDGKYSTDPTPWHFYAKAGKYYICMKVTDSTAGGTCSDTKCDSVQVGNTNVAPVCDASFSFITGITDKDSLHFYNKNTSKNYKTYAWSFGDGNYSTDRYSWHHYAKSGKYYICLKVTDSTAGGTCTDTKCDSVTVGSASAPSCDASFTFNVGTTNKDSIHFYNKTTSKTYKTYAWSFGDGKYSTDQSPWHYYAKPGKYYICLKVTDSTSAGTCTDTKCDSVQVGSSSNKFYLYGLVDLGSGNSLASGDYGRAWAIKYDSANGTLTAIDSVKFDSTHHYLFILPAGDYLVKAALDSGSTNYKYYLPTYYENKLHWDTALMIHLTAHKTNANIHLIKGKNHGGPGFIGGYVSQGANKTEAVGDPVAGVEVILYNDLMEPIDYTYSKTDGTYGFENLAYGTYYIHPEVVGKQTYELQVTIGASNDTRKDVNITVNSLYVVVEMGIDYIISTENIISNVYPNPTSGNLNILINNDKNITGKISIIDIQGKTIIEQSINSRNTLQLDVTQLPQGIYNVMLQTKDGETFSRRFMKQ